MLLGLNHVPAVVANQDSRFPASSPTKLRLDTQDLQEAFVDTYRSLCSSEHLFDMLVKRFQNAHKVQHLSHPPYFPNWSALNVKEDYNVSSADEGKSDEAVQLGVLSFLSLWVERCAQDFYDSPRLWAMVSDFLRVPPFAVSPEVSASHAALIDRFALATLVHSRDTDLPSVPPPPPPTQPSIPASAKAGGDSRTAAESPAGSSSPSPSRPEVLDLDSAFPSDVVDYLESVVCIYLHKITRRDWTLAAHLLRHQAESSPLAWYPPSVLAAAASAAASGAGHVKPRDECLDLSMYGILDSVPVASTSGPHHKGTPLASPSPSYSPCPSPSPSPSPSPIRRENQLLLRALPAALTFGCAVQHMLRGWVAAQMYVFLAPCFIFVQRFKKKREKELPWLT